MRNKILQAVGLLFALSVVSFGTDAATAQESPASPPQQSSKANDGNPFNAKTSSELTSTDLHNKVADPKTKKLPTQDESAKNADVQSSHSESTRLTQKVRAALENTGHIEYNDVPFIDVKRELEDKFGFNIVLDQSAVDDALTEEEMFTVRLRDVRYSDGLRLMLRDFNATYMIQNGIIRIISLSNVNDPENHSLAMLNVQPTLDLIEKFDARTNSPRYKKQEFHTSEIPVIILSETIMSMVQDDAWRATGRGEAALEIAGGILILRGPEELVSEVKDFIQDLHAELEAKSH